MDEGNEGETERGVAGKTERRRRTVANCVHWRTLTVGLSEDIYARRTHPEMAKEEASLPPAVESVDQGTACPGGKHVVEHSGIGGEERKGPGMCD